jgi:hypothetical protein
MKALHGFGFAIIGTLLSAGSWLACSGDDNKGGGGSSSTTTTNHDGGATSNSSTTQGTSGGSTTSATTSATPDGGRDAGDAGDAGDATADASDGDVPCSTYCADIVSACGTDKTDPFAQYQSLAECLEVCPLLRRSTDPNVNNIGCRDTHAHLAMNIAKDPHCWHAGPYGYGVCGDPCKSFCTIDTEFCSDDAGTGYDGAAPYSSVAACETQCPSYPVITPFDAGDAGLVYVDSGGFFAWATNTSGANTLDCREYHILNAINTDPDAGGNVNAPNIHCGHTASISLNNVCGDGG